MTRAAMPLLKRARVYTLKPGDVVVLETSELVSHDEDARFTAYASLRFAPARVVLLSGGMTMRVLRMTPAQQDAQDETDRYCAQGGRTR